MLEGGRAARGGQAVVKLGCRASLGAGRKKWGRWRGFGEPERGSFSPNPTPESFPQVTRNVEICKLPRKLFSYLFANVCGVGGP